MAGDTGEERAASPPALLAYTTSGLQHAGKKGARGAKKGGASRQRGGTGTRAPATAKRFRKPTEPVLFDESSRRDFLTGFRKRKQARIETSRKKALEREKEEKRQVRADARQARKDQAAENVRMEKIAYGDGLNDSEEGEDDDEEEEEDEGGKRERPPSAYETEEHHTTVTVQEWNPEEEEEDVASAPAKAPAPVAQPSARVVTQGQRKAQSINAALPPSSRRMAKKIKNTSDSASSSSAKRKADAGDISKLLDLGKAPVAAPIPVFHTSGDGSKKTNASTSLIKKKPKFHYESKLERAKAKAKINEDRAKHAERRKEERLLAERGGRPKGGRRRK